MADDASFWSDFQKNQNPSQINNPDRIDNGQALAYNYLTGPGSSATSAPPPYSATKTPSSFKMDWGGIATAAAGGLPALAGSLIGSVTSFATDIDRNNILRKQVEGTLALNNRTLDFQQKAFDQQWQAARSIGLASPSQFSGGGDIAFYGNSAGPSVSRGMRAPSNSPFVR